eukprot:3918451-Amphidinium_carterae.1
MLVEADADSRPTRACTAMLIFHNHERQWGRESTLLNEKSLTLKADCIENQLHEASFSDIGCSSGFRTCTLNP